MANLNTPQIVRGPLLASEMHRVTVMPQGLDYQGRQQTRPIPAECCTELGAEDDPYDGTQVFRGLFSAVAITAILAGVVLALS